MSKYLHEHWYVQSQVVDQAGLIEIRPSNTDPHPTVKITESDPKVGTQIRLNEFRPQFFSSNI